MSRRSTDPPRSIFRSRQHLEVLVAIAESGSMTRAAETLKITQPNVSRVVSTLEGDIGAELFERSARSVRATLLGTFVVDRARSVLREMEVADHDVDRLLEVLDRIRSGLDAS